MRIFRKYKMFFINALLALSIFLGILFINHISPFGNMMLGRSDAITMFKPMLYDYIMKLKSHTLLNYSFNNGLGSATIFNYIYDLASPINLVALFFHSPDSMFLSVTITKIIICSICMTYYTSKKTNSSFAILVATLSYVYSSWFIAYYFYLPWLDIFMIFPLFQYGLEKLLDEHKYHLYIFCLSYMIITNLYLCFSVCVYTIIFFVIYTLFYKKDSFRKKLLTFDYIALSTIVSMLLSFFYLYAWYDSLLKIKIGFDQFHTAAYTVSLIDFLKSFFYVNISFTTEMSGKVYPNIACPSIILVSFIYYLISKNDSIRNKIFFIISCIICSAIIFIPQLDFVVNAFHQIRGLTYRYSFIITFLMISIFIRICNFKSISIKRWIISCLVVLFGFIVLNYHLPANILIVNIFIILTSVLFGIFFQKKSIRYGLCIIFLFQAFFITNIYFRMQPQKEIPENIDYHLENVEYRINNQHSSIEYDDQEAIHSYYNNKTTFVYSSLTYSNIIYLFHNLGNETFSNTYSIMYDDNSIPSLLFNVKSSQNDYYLEKIYSANSNIKDTMIDEDNIKNTMEYIIEDMTNIKDIYLEEVIPIEEHEDNYIINTRHPYSLVELGQSVYALYNDTYVLNSNSYQEATIYTVRDDKLKEIYDYLGKNQIHYSYYNDNHMKGTIQVDEGQLIFTSIPYDKDWVVKVDGERVEPVLLLNSLMGIEVSPGEHEIELEYKTHFIVPTIISISTFILLVINYIMKKRS